jgi:lysophospholipase L1-like esterase
MALKFQPLLPYNLVDIPTVAQGGYVGGTNFGLIGDSESRGQGTVAYWTQYAQTVTAASNATPIAITTAANHNLATNDQVIIASVGGNTAANGTWTVTVTGATTFTLNTSVGNGAYTTGGTVSLIPTQNWHFNERRGHGLFHVANYMSGGRMAMRANTAYGGTTSRDWYYNGLNPTYSATITNATNASPIVITTSTVHNLTTGQEVTIAGVLGNTNANGTYVATVADSTSFQLTGRAGNSAYTSGGTVTLPYSVNSQYAKTDWTFRFNPKAVFICLGMNDCNSASAGLECTVTEHNQYISGLIDRCLQTGAVPIVMPSPVRDDTTASTATNYAAAFPSGPQTCAQALSDMGDSDMIEAYQRQIPQFDPKPYINLTSAFSTWYSSTSATITGATNATPSVVTTSGAHGLVTGDLVTIEGVLASGAAATNATTLNNTWVVTVTGTTTFTCNGSAVTTGAYTSGGTVRKGYRLDGVHWHLPKALKLLATGILANPFVNSRLGDRAKIARYALVGGSERDNLIGTSACFQDGTTGGTRPTNWIQQGSATGTSFALNDPPVQVPPIPGKVLAITRTAGNATDQIFYKAITTGFAAGDTLRMTGLFRASGFNDTTIISGTNAVANTDTVRCFYIIGVKMFNSGVDIGSEFWVRPLDSWSIDTDGQFWTFEQDFIVPVGVTVDTLRFEIHSGGSAALTSQNAVIEFAALRLENLGTQTSVDA